MSDALLYDFHLFWMAVALVVALVGCGCMTVGLILRHTFVRPTTPEAFVRIAGELCRQRIISPWLPVDALTLQQLETYQRSSTQAGLICRGVGILGGASVCLVLLQLPVVTSLFSVAAIEVGSLLFAVLMLGLVLGEGGTAFLIARSVTATSFGQPVQMSPALRWRDTRFAWTLIPYTLALLYCACIGILLACGKLPENGAFILNSTGGGGRWVYPPVWLPLSYPIVALLIIGSGFLLTRRLLRPAPLPVGVYPSFAIRARKYFLIRQSFYIFLSFPTQFIALTLLSMSEFVSFETLLPLYGFLAAVVFFMVVPLINIFPRMQPLPPFSPAELPPPPVTPPPPVAATPTASTLARK